MASFIQRLGLIHFASAVAGFLTVFIVWAVHPSTTTWSEAALHLAYRPCGTDAQIATERGCGFELATGTWQLPECTHLEEEIKFRRSREWKFYVYKNSTYAESHPSVNGIHDRKDMRELGVYELPDLDPTTQIWTNWEFHLYRCSWLWKRDVLAANGNITGPIGGQQHCVDEGLMKESKYSLEDLVAGYHVRYNCCTAPPNYVV